MTAVKPALHVPDRQRAVAIQAPPLRLARAPHLVQRESALKRESVEQDESAPAEEDEAGLPDLPVQRELRENAQRVAVAAGQREWWLVFRGRSADDRVAAHLKLAPVAVEGEPAADAKQDEDTEDDAGRDPPAGRGLSAF